MSESPFESAAHARANALRLAFAPFLFQAVCALRDFGVLELAWSERSRGVTRAEVAAATGLSLYAATLLLEAGLAAEALSLEGDRFHLTRTGYYLMGDEMTRVNLEFARDVCYRALERLPESLREGRPRGLAELGDGFGSSDSLYRDFAALSPSAMRSWLAFDHYYSTLTYDTVWPHVFAASVEHVVDVGANTGVFAQACLERDASVKVTLVDHAAQLEFARTRLQQAGLLHRVDFVNTDLLAFDPELGSCDVVWMSQVIDCLAETEVVELLSRVRKSLRRGGRLLVLEPCWDLQPQRAGRDALTLLSLYFACAANGKSRMYDSGTLDKLIKGAAFQVVERLDGLGIGHSLFVCQPG